MMKVSCERRLVELSCFKAQRLCLSDFEALLSLVILVC